MIRKVSRVSRVKAKQALCSPSKGMYREQESSHVWWPDHTMRKTKDLQDSIKGQTTGTMKPK